MHYSLCFILGALLSIAFAQTRQYYFVGSAQTWTNAQSVCRQDYTDLATIENLADVDAVLRTNPSYSGKAWIGLYDELYNSWKWSLTDSSFYGAGEYTFRNWISGSPNNFGGQQYCVRFLSDSFYLGGWDDRQCSDLRRFLCYTGIVGGSPSYFVSTQSLNWTEAQRFCRENYIDLASIRNQAENNNIRTLLGGIEVWIGLYRDKLWSDSSPSLFQHWAAGQPDNDNSRCVAASFSDMGKWLDEDCAQSFPFICYKPIPANTEGFRASSQNESSITLQWNKISNSISFVLQFNGTETNIRAPDGDGPVNYTVSSLTAGTKYTFILFSVLNNVRSSGISTAAVTTPRNTEAVRVSDQDENSITLQWNKINNNTSFVLQFNGSETNIRAPDGFGPVNYTVSSLTAGTKYTFSLLSVFENVRSSGVQLAAVTAPQNAERFTSLRQDETSITLQWDIINNNVSFILQYNETELNIAAPAGNQPLLLTVSSLTAGTRYTFTLFSVFENVRSSGVSIAAVTAPVNAEGFRASEQNETSITLQWNRGDNNTSFVLQFNGTETNIRTPDGDEPVKHTVTSLTAGTKYTFRLFSLFENVRSSGVQYEAVTAPRNTEAVRVSDQDESSITLQWNKINNSTSFVLQFNGSETNIRAPDGDGPVNYTVSSLTDGNKYTFSLFSVFENVRSSGVSIAAVTAPENAEGFRASEQNETSITLQWNKGDNNTSFVLQFNGTETNIRAPDGDEPVKHTITSLTAGTKYTFSLFSVFENVRSSGVQYEAVTAPRNTEAVRVSDQDESSITLQWNKINNSTSFVLQFNGSETNIRAPDGDGPVNYTVSSLTDGNKYTFTLFSVFENVRSSGVSIAAVTAPENAEGFRASEQNETSITLQWNKGDNNTSFVLQFNGTETNIRAPDGDGPVKHTVTSLTAGTKYTFILYHVFMNVRSSAVNITVATAPTNAEGLRVSEQDESSITLQWNIINNSTSFVLQFNGSETNIRAPDGFGPVNYTVSSLSAGNKYTFSLFSVFENVRSSGVQLTAVTAPQNAERFTSLRQDETSITLQWDIINNNVSFILQYNETELNIAAPAGQQPLLLTVSSLTAGTRYTFTLFSVFENIRSSGVSIAAVTAPENAEGFRASEQNETSITLQWNKGDNNTSFVLQFNGTETNIRAPDGDGPVKHTITSLTAGTKYTFILYHVFMNVRSSAVNITVATAPTNAEAVRVSDQDESSITLQWNKINNSTSFVLQFNGSETNIRAPDGFGPVNYTVSSLTAGTKYTFSLFSVFENVRSSGVQLTAVTAPQNAERFTSLRQDESSITLQWDIVNNNVSFILQYNETELNIAAPAGNQPLLLTVSSLTAGTRYTFTLFSVFENVRSSGVSIAAVTAPENAEGFRASEQNETSITLQWNKGDNNTSFVLQFNGTETNIRAPDGDGPVKHTVTSLTAGTKYTFILYHVFMNVRSSAVNITVATAPTNAEGLRASEQDENSITLQWNKINNSTSFVLRFNSKDTFIRAPDGDEPVTHTVSSLTAGTKYTFSLFSVFENVRSSGVQYETITAPDNAEGLRASGQDESSITLQWNKINNSTSFVLQFNGSETNIRAPDGFGPVNYTVSSLTAGTKYTFSLFSVFENIRSSGVQYEAVTAPTNAEGFRSSDQDETSITLQWNKINNSNSFVLQFNGIQTFIRAPDGDGPVTHTVSSLSAGTRYTFTLFSVFENIRSSGVSIAAVTAPENAEGFRASEQNETSITLQWNRGDNNTSFVLQFNGTETNIRTPDGDGPVKHTVTSLTAGTKYTFILYHVFMNVRSSAVNITVATAPTNAEGLRVSDQDESSITLQWNKINNSTSFVLQFNGSETNIRAPDGDGPVNYTVSSLSAGNKYTFRLLSVFENVRSSGVQYEAVTAPRNTEAVRVSDQDESSITLQWNKINNSTSFVLQFNGSETNIRAPDGFGPVNYTVSSLSAGTKYTFSLFSVFENVRSSGVQLTAVTAPQNAERFTSLRQDESSITLQWDIVNNNVSFILQYNETELNIAAPAGQQPLLLTVSSLTAGTRYTFTLFSVFENIRSSGVSIAAVTAPENAEGFRASEQNETSITLQWNKGDNNTSFVLQFNGTETNIRAPDGDGPVKHTVTSLTAGTKYTFILYHVFMNVRSSAVNITVATAPTNAEGLRASDQDENSITLQWNKINNSTSFVLQFNSKETFIRAPDGDEPVTHTVSSLTAGTKYTFSLFSVFENVRSSGVQYETITAPDNAEGLRASGQDESSITLQWNKINNSTSFVLQFNGSETNIRAPDGFGPVNYTVSSLTAGTKYTFSLFSVFENIRSSGVQYEAVTAPTNAEGFRSSDQDETSITLQWNKINNSNSFVLQFNGIQTFIRAPDGDGPVTHTVSSLSAGNKYTFSLFSVFENIRSSGVSIAAVTAPENAEGFRASEQNETSITLQWNKINNSTSFVLQFNGSETNIRTPDGDGPVKHTVTSLTAGTKYTFILYHVFMNVRSSAVNITVATAPTNAEGLRASEQNENSITLQWNKINNSTSFVLQFNSIQTFIRAPDGFGPVNYTVSSLTAGTKYTFRLFSVFENIRSSGVQLTAVTAPKNAEGFRASEQNETSITLQWNKGDNNTSFVLQFNGTETNISSPAGNGPVKHTVTSLTARSNYTFTLFCVFENVRSSGVSIFAATGPNYVLGWSLRLKLLRAMRESEMEDVLIELFRKYNLPPQFTLKIVSSDP
ncbi:tenascin-X-like [Gambusia affinis]|uniref:tenascin-X-like n=1 Tax=Gambusia affinis TaxID=33528 RepID=UPI001CDCEFD9|nr:tenascin-X-like [Gambusia affinis]